MHIGESLFGIFIRTLPKAHVSYWFGKFARVGSPRWFSRLCVKIYASIFKINFTELTCGLEEFSTLADFFKRDLPPKARPLASGLISPIDGTLRAQGQICEGVFTIAKDIPYSVQGLLGRSNFNSNFLNGTFFNFYLSPRDYHHIHAPFDGEVVYVGHIRGTFWPVNDWALENIPHLFEVNERQVVVLKTVRGLVAVVMIAALNVGGITLQSNITPGTWVQGGQRLGNF